MPDKAKLATGHLVFLLWAVAVGGYFVARGLFAAPDQTQGVLGLDAAYRIGGPSKLLAFVIATYFASDVARNFDADNPTRKAWLGLALGFTAFALGQGILVAHQLYIPGDTPFPSAADPSFMFGYVAIIAALIHFVRAYMQSGLVLAQPAALWQSAGLVALPLIVFCVVVTQAVLAKPDTALQKTVGLGYPLLDAALLVPTFLMARLTMAMRGGQLALPWALMLAGFVLFTCGDAIYAVPGELNWKLLDPLLDLCFAVGYLLCAWGCYAQRRLVAV